MLSLSAGCAVEPASRGDRGGDLQEWNPSGTKNLVQRVRGLLRAGRKLKRLNQAAATAQSALDFEQSQELLFDRAIDWALVAVASLHDSGAPAPTLRRMQLLRLDSDGYGYENSVRHLEGSLKRQAPTLYATWNELGAADDTSGAPPADASGVPNWLTARQTRLSFEDRTTLAWLASAGLIASFYAADSHPDQSTAPDVARTISEISQEKLHGWQHLLVFPEGTQALLDLTGTLQKEFQPTEPVSKSLIAIERHFNQLERHAAARETREVCMSQTAELGRIGLIELRLQIPYRQVQQLASAVTSACEYIKKTAQTFRLSSATEQTTCQLRLPLFDQVGCSCHRTSWAMVNTKSDKDTIKSIDATVPSTVVASVRQAFRNEALAAEASLFRCAEQL